MDYGGANDGRCEFSWITRCPEPAVQFVTFGQFDAWTYRYCAQHAEDAPGSVDE